MMMCDIDINLVRRCNLCRVAVVLLSGLLATACDYDQFAFDRQIVGPYRLQSADDLSDISIDYAINGLNGAVRVQGSVFAYGFNDKYIVAARHPKGAMTPADLHYVEYYFIIRSLDSDAVLPDASVRGPFNEVEFRDYQKSLGLPRLKELKTV